ncbi:hypothetical protein CONLIGDRAFT_678000 [Coniochaeta ligniaria NRRL 30616]|uniref:Uncharacterized protein n=1 Tax=Coniochaeta ligniaria NRRL 30616 TaxID=1408157 RepID=A0A1J7IW47_9PEZI|nr:hypothetical protein CONLIGDRAFT_678000 [Coniochaeta ligniaria NRRL 30616]
MTKKNAAERDNARGKLLGTMKRLGFTDSAARSISNRWVQKVFPNEKTPGQDFDHLKPETMSNFASSVGEISAKTKMSTKEVRDKWEACVAIFWELAKALAADGEVEVP